MVVRDGRRQSVCHPCSYIIAEHVMFVKQSLTYLAVNIIRVRKERGSAGREGEGCAGGRARREWD